MTLSDKKIENHLRALTNLFNASQYDLLILKCKKIIKEFPEYVILYNILGSAYQNIGELGYAKEIFNKGIKMDPNNISIMNNLANTYKQIGEVSAAENLYQKIIKKKPKYINAYINYGNLKKDANRKLEQRFNRATQDQKNWSSFSRDTSFPFLAFLSQGHLPFHYTLLNL